MYSTIFKCLVFKVLALDTKGLGFKKCLAVVNNIKGLTALLPC